jgi:dipeptidyl aminopeptidase/acylaminoacyl peptidase
MKPSRRLVLACFSALGTLAVAPLRGEERPAFSIDDYLRLERITQVALSADGKRVAYVVQAGAMLDYYSDKLPPEEKRNVRTVYLQPVGGGVGRPLEAAADAQELVWLPGSRDLAFLSSRNGVSQVLSLDPDTGAVRPRTSAKDGVESFRFSPDGRSLAFVTRAPAKPSESLYRRFLDGDSGIVIDSDTLSVYDFVDPANDAARRPEPAVLHVALDGGEAFAVAVPGEPGAGADDYHWSPDGGSLSVTYTPEGVRQEIVGTRTSVGVFDVATRGFRTIAAGVASEGGRPGTRYVGGEWVPGTRSVFVRRVTELDPWVSPNHPDWAIVDAAAGIGSATEWHAAEMYGGRARVLIAGGSRIFLENTAAGVRTLFRLNPAGAVPSEVVAGIGGSSSYVRFSGDFETAVFVNESLTRPPELYVRSGRAPARALTSLNAEIARRVRHTAREVSWRSADGVTVRGWLLEPVGGGRGPRR